MDEKFNLRLHNAMIEVAVCEFWEKKIAETDWNRDGDHEFSDRHTARIKAVIKKHKTKARNRKVFRTAKRVAIVILILLSVTSAILSSSAAAREAVYRIWTNVIELFRQEHPDAPLDGDEFMDYQTDKQIEQIEKHISDALSTVGLPHDTSLQIHVDGWWNVTITGLGETDAAKIKPYIEYMGAVLSTAYASENKNQLYYVQSVIKGYEDIKSESPEIWFDTIREYRQIIREYMFANDITSTDEIMAQMRNISYVGGKLIFEVK